MLDRAKHAACLAVHVGDAEAVARIGHHHGHGQLLDHLALGEGLFHRAAQRGDRVLHPPELVAPRRRGEREARVAGGHALQEPRQARHRPPDDPARQQGRAREDRSDQGGEAEHEATRLVERLEHHLARRLGFGHVGGRETRAEILHLLRGGERHRPVMLGQGRGERAKPRRGLDELLEGL